MSEGQLEKFIPDVNEQNLILKKMVQAIFDSCGYCSKINFERYKIEAKQVTIENIEYCEDLLTVLQRLRTFFWVTIRPDSEDEEIGGEIYHCSRLNIELILKDD